MSRARHTHLRYLVDDSDEIFDSVDKGMYHGDGGGGGVVHHDPPTSNTT